MNRIFRNLTTTRFALNRYFPDSVLDAIEQAIADSENTHSGEIQFAIETALDVQALIGGVTPREEAVRAFSDLLAWDTEANNGVLIYVLLSERDIEIVADRGYLERVGDAEWQTICDDMRAAYTAGEFEQGSLAGIEAVSRLIARHFPPTPGDINERPNRPVIL